MYFCCPATDWSSTKLELVMLAVVLLQLHLIQCCSFNIRALMPQCLFAGCQSVGSPEAPCSALHAGSTPEEFTLEKRQQARDSLMEYARLIQGPPLPAEAQPMHMHSGADPKDFAADDGRET